MRTVTLKRMITVRGLCKRYGPTLAVDGLSFEVRPGRVTGFLGPNGAGKSTTLRMILGLDAPTSGSAVVAGRRYSEIRRPLYQVGALLDASAVAGGRSGYEHLAALARSNGMARGRVDAVLDEVGLTSAARRRVGGYSLGMKQRLGIAAALLGDPPILIFDEPVNGLDPEGIRWIRSLLRKLGAEGRTVLVSSHVMSEMENTADHVVVIGQGKLIADHPVAELIEQGSRLAVAVRSADDRALAEELARAGAVVTPSDAGGLTVSGLPAERIGELALESRIVIHQLRSLTATLEEAFMALTADSLDYSAQLATASPAAEAGR
jgi:ABC-2 type transport system ATP-binding protein